MPAIVGLMQDDQDRDVRRKCVEMLGRVSSDELLKILPALVERLQDSHSIVRKACVDVLAKVPPDVLVDTLLPQLVVLLEDAGRADVSRVVLDVFKKLLVDEIAKFVPKLVEMLDDRDEDVRQAVEVLGLLPAHSLESRFDDKDRGVRLAAVSVLGKHLPPWGLK